MVYGNNTVDKPYTDRCLALIDELGVKDNFTFAGFHSNPAALYHEGDVFALSSISEGFPFSVIEAMACGRPVVATDVGGVKEAVAGGVGIVVPPRGHEALGDGLADLLLDHDRRRELARTGRERAVDQFGVERMLEAHRVTYRHWAGLPTEAPLPASLADVAAPVEEEERRGEEALATPPSAVSPEAAPPEVPPAEAEPSVVWPGDAPPALVPVPSLADLVASITGGVGPPVDDDAPPETTEEPVPGEAAPPPAAPPVPPRPVQRPRPAARPPRRPAPLPGTEWVSLGDVADPVPSGDGFGRGGVRSGETAVLATPVWVIPPPRPSDEAPPRVVWDGAGPTIYASA